MVGARTGAAPPRRGHTDAVPDTPPHAEGRDPGGRTTISPLVIEKSAARAVREIPGARRVRSRAARARVSGEIVLLKLRIGVLYPRSVREVAVRVREHVRRRVERTTGKRVHHIDIEIAELVR